MNMIDALPFLTGWEYRVFEYEPPSPPISINPGERTDIMEEEVGATGWFLSGGLMVDNPFATVRIVTDMWTVDATPSGVYDYGLTIQPKVAAWIPKYSPSDGEYSLQFALTWMPFNARRHVYLSNPTLTPELTPNTVCKLKSYTFAVVEIIDKESFLRSYRELE